MALYRVSRWNEFFENNRTRELKRLDWVPVPNKMDGRGYTALVEHPNGAAHLGGWIAILEIASRQKVRGEIPQDGAGLSQEGAASRARIPFPSIPFSSVQAVEVDFNLRFSAAWDRHKKHRGGVTRQMVAQRLLDVDWTAWDARHLPFCEFWDRAGWTMCTLGMLEWWENGMPHPPPEPVVAKKPASKSKSDLEEFLREAR